MAQSQMMRNAASLHCLHDGVIGSSSTFGRRTHSTSSATSLFFLSVYSYVKPTADIALAPAREHQRVREQKEGGHQLAPFQKKVCCSQQGWFEFSTASGGKKVDGVSVGDFTILSHLQVRIKQLSDCQQSPYHQNFVRRLVNFVNCERSSVTTTSSTSYIEVRRTVSFAPST